eukprot:2077790-Pleurochrysis_carterae.AAC.1
MSSICCPSSASVCEFEEDGGETSYPGVLSTIPLEAEEGGGETSWGGVSSITCGGGGGGGAC